MKKILFDLNHPVDVNFFKNTIIQLNNYSNFQIDIIFRERGRLESIANYELPVKAVKIGSHKKNVLSKVFGQLRREWQTYKYIKKGKYAVVICFGGTSVLGARLAKVPFLAFDDDFEYKLAFYYANIFATKHIYPDFIRYSNKKVIKYAGYKEFAYLHPNYFTPNIIALEDYKLKENSYIFIRHISNASLNYTFQQIDILAFLNKVSQYNFLIVLSIEDKSLLPFIEKNIIILNEPVADIYSIMYYSLLCISFGDTVAREAALLGVPTVYAGGRNMCVHNELVDMGIINQTSDLKDIEDIITSDLNEKKELNRMKIQDGLKHKWVDTTALIINQIQSI